MLRIVAALMALAGPVWADGNAASDYADLYPKLPGVEYFCHDARGTRFELGQFICVTASCQTWMARCDMSQNNTTWRKINEGCTTAEVRLLERLVALS